MKLLNSALVTACTLLLAIAPSQAATSNMPQANPPQPAPNLLARVPRSDQLYMKIKISPQGIHKQYLILTRKGIAVRTKAGNLATLRQNLQRVNLGKYVRQGNRLAIQWGNGDRWQMTARPNGWQLGTQKSNLYAAAFPVAAQGLRGRYVAQSSRAAGLVGGPAPSVNAYTQTTFLFSGDGRFQSTGFAGASGSTYNNAGRTSGRGVSTSNRNRAGRYQLGGYQLALSDTQGRRTQHTIFRLPGWGDAVMIDERIFQRR